MTQFCFLLAVAFSISAPVAAQESATDHDGELRWWKGNLHTHSFWSDGNDFPEMIARWYAEREYHFLSLTDHNILSRGERWMSLERIQSYGTDKAMEKYLAAFGSDWVEQRTNDQGSTEVRLRPLDEFREHVERPGEFLMIEGEEISDSVKSLPIHLNATNLADLLPPVGGDTVVETIRNNLRAAQEQSDKSGREILVHLNHPNFGWAVTAEDIAIVLEERFIEVFNAHPSVNHLGDATRASVEEIWDIANTLRLAHLDAAPLYGLGTDDSHSYHGQPGAQPGRAWVMVRSRELRAESIIGAIHAGDFYASSGISLHDVQFDEADRRLTISIAAEEGVEYQTQFIGTRRGYDAKTRQRLDKDGKPLVTTRRYSADVGAILDQQTGAHPTYQLDGDELYVRAVITSSRPHPNPSFENQFEQAWTQPVGWKVSSHSR